ncbi:ABC transporter ATP-binding protein [Halobacillus sp. ACCC02827]|uniref:ATP-binding cassette domain-containing protein n=1 Tax=Halobacillus sp. ACCC02827 TaxID=3052090 RepID=UPI0025700213|nr:ABC transporter ATP-binding protein [Halobacillus sp. ACCC02827]WJE16482.1 ABC transporter ATP-binding protein [Halobacillus sp. ACCC02827]
MKAIKCENVTKTYKKKKALDRLNVSIEAGKIVGLVGRNGAGKTTWMKVVAGMVKESKGSVEVFGEHPFNNLMISANSVYIDDRMSFPATLTLEEILMEGKRFYQYWDHDLALRLFDYFGFERGERHHTLSKGRESIFHMIFGLATRCSLTIFDEPTTGMDAAVRKDFYRALLKDYLSSPRTIVLSTHHLEEMEDILEEVLLLHKGKLLLQTSMDELKEYAVRLTAPLEILRPWTRNREILYEQLPEERNSCVIVRNDWTETEQTEMRKEGIRIAPVSASDVCVYMTEDKVGRGGIDDVFDRSENR